MENNKGNYVDLFKTDLLDEKIKNSFSNTSSALNNAYSARSMPDLRVIRNIKDKALFVQEPVLLSPRNPKSIDVEDFPLDSKKPSLSVPDLQAETLEQIPFYSYNPVTKRLENLEHLDVKFPKGPSLSVPDLQDISYSPDNVSRRLRNLQSLTQQPQNIQLSSRQYSLEAEDANERHFRRQSNLAELTSLTKKSPRGLSIAEQYRKFQVEIQMKKDIDHAHNLYKQTIPNINENRRRRLSRQDSGESFRLNPIQLGEDSAEISNRQPASNYERIGTAPRPFTGPTIESDIYHPVSVPFSEPIRSSTNPENSGSSYPPVLPTSDPVPPIYQYSGSALAANIYPPFNPHYPGVWNKESDIYYNNKPEQQDETNNVNNTNKSNHTYEAEKANKQEEQFITAEKKNNSEQEKRNTKKKKEDKQSSYSKLAQKRTDMKKSAEKRVKRKKSKDDAEKTKSKYDQAKYDQEIAKDNRDNSEDPGIYCRCSDEEPAEENIDAKQSSDVPPVPKPLWYGENYKYYSQFPLLQHSQYGGNDILQCSKYSEDNSFVSDKLIADQAESSVDNGRIPQSSVLPAKYLYGDEKEQYGKDQLPNSQECYEDCPLAQKYFSGMTKVRDYKSPSLIENFTSNLSPNTVLPPIQDRNSPVVENKPFTTGFSSSHHSSGYNASDDNDTSSQFPRPLKQKSASFSTRISPKQNGFLSGPDTDSEEYISKKNKMRRQREYAEILRQQQKDMSMQKPQIRSWNLKTQEELERETQESKRMAAINYAKTIPKPIVKNNNAPLPTQVFERAELFDAIEEMKKRHEQDKRAIEEMRAEINQRIAQVTV